MTLVCGKLAGRAGVIWASGGRLQGACFRGQGTGGYGMKAECGPSGRLLRVSGGERGSRSRASRDRGSAKSMGEPPARSESGCVSFWLVLF